MLILISAQFFNVPEGRLWSAAARCRFQMYVKSIGYSKAQASLRTPRASPSTKTVW